MCAVSSEDTLFFAFKVLKERGGEVGTAFPIMPPAQHTDYNPGSR